ncbi:MAG: murein L,D-transpeptidase [Desulfatibacillaceae bacterium]
MNLLREKPRTALFLSLSLLLAAAAICPLTHARPPSAREAPATPCQYIRLWLEDSDGRPLVLLGEVVRRRDVVRRFYRQRDFSLAWMNSEAVSPLAYDLMKRVARADGDGLAPADYHFRAIRLALVGVQKQLEGVYEDDPATGAAADVLLTDAFFTLAGHLSRGRVKAGAPTPVRDEAAPGADFPVLLRSALEDGGVVRALDRVSCKYLGYERLRDALDRYTRIAATGGWPLIPEEIRAERGDGGPHVEMVRARLEATGDVVRTEEPKARRVFDGDLEKAVISFQERHGLAPDGRVGPGTVRAMRIPVEEAVRKIRLNLERWRWLPARLEDRFVMVNLADMTLSLVEQGRLTLSMRVVVGRKYRKTPVFSAPMRYLVFNPYWHVPRSIAVRDILPDVQKNPGYIASHRMRVYAGAFGPGNEVDPSTVDWGALSAGNFPYRIRQEPGPRNALGRVKFVFPNPYTVFMHDTPSRHLFEKARRLFSSGCIRLERPLDLAEAVLRGKEGWDRQRIEQVVDSGAHRTVHLPEPMEVRLVYWTAWADPALPRVHFRDDVYGRDRDLGRALFSPAPTPADVRHLPRQ